MTTWAEGTLHVPSHIERHLMEFIELTHNNALLSNFHRNKNSVSFGTGLNIFSALYFLWIQVQGTSTKLHSLRKSVIYEKLRLSLMNMLYSIPR